MWRTVLLICVTLLYYICHLACESCFENEVDKSVKATPVIYICDTFLPSFIYFLLPLPLSAWVSFQGKSVLEGYYTVPNYWSFSPPILANKPNEQSEPRKSWQLKADHIYLSRMTKNILHSTVILPLSRNAQWFSIFKLVALKICWSSLRLFSIHTYYISSKGRDQLYNEMLKRFVQNPILSHSLLHWNIPPFSIMGKFCENTTKKIFLLSEYELKSIFFYPNIYFLSEKLL